MVVKYVMPANSIRNMHLHLASYEYEKVKSINLPDNNAGCKVTCLQ